MSFFIILSLVLFTAAITVIYYMIIQPIWVRSRSYSNKRIEHENGELKSIISESVVLDGDLEDSRIVRLLKKVDSGYFSYDRIYTFLRSNGNHCKCTPGTFILVKFFMTVAAILVAMMLELPFVFWIVAGIFAFFILDIYEVQENKKDEKTMIFDLQNIYNCLNIQTKAGNTNLLLIIESIHEVSEQKRLKKALEELAVDIFLANDYRVPFDIFKSKFKSTHISILVNSILQYQETGVNTTSFKDMARLCSDKSDVLIRSRIESIESKSIFIQLAYIIALMMFILSFVFGQLDVSGLMQ